VLELAIVLVVFILLTFGMFDLGLGVFHYHVLTNAARQAARRAIVHGANANVLGVWNPGSNASQLTDVKRDGTTINFDKEIQDLLILCDLEHTTITLEWIDGNNAAGSRVRATITSPYQPLVNLRWNGNPLLTPFTLRAVSTMQISH
jgi:hypothetical protein